VLGHRGQHTGQGGAGRRVADQTVDADGVAVDDGPYAGVAMTSAST
jgi:hypothetical protein